MADDDEDWTKFSDEVFGSLKKSSSDPQKSKKFSDEVFGAQKPIPFANYQRSGPRHQSKQVDRLRASGYAFIGGGMGLFIINFFLDVLPAISRPEVFWLILGILLIVCLPLILLGFYRIGRAKVLMKNRMHQQALDQEDVDWHIPQNRSDFASDLEIIARDDPQNSDPDLWFYLGEDQMVKKDFPGAMTAIKRALKLEARFPAAWFRLGNLLVMLQDYPAAKEALKTGLQFDEGNIPALKLFCKVLVFLGEEEKARKIFEEILKEDPDYFEK